MTDGGLPELTIEIELIDGDIDELGHLNQARYHNLLGAARAKLLASRAGPAADFVLARIELDYHHEVPKADGCVEVRVSVVRVGNKSVTIEHDVRRPDGTLAARGVSVLVAWDPIARRSRSLTDVERAALRGE